MHSGCARPTPPALARRTGHRWMAGQNHHKTQPPRLIFYFKSETCIWRVWEKIRLKTQKWGVQKKVGEWVDLHKGLPYQSGFKGQLSLYILLLIKYSGEWFQLNFDLLRLGSWHDQQMLPHRCRGHQHLRWITTLIFYLKVPCLSSILTPLVSVFFKN